MSSTDHRDSWVSGKQITPARLSELKTWITEKADNEIHAARHARRDMSFANNFPAFYAALDELTAATRRLSHVAHQMKFMCDWVIPPLPEFNDQSINQFFLLPEFRSTFWLEGAVFCGLGIPPGKRILELCCGMGWYTDYFYSPFASEIVAVDFDPRAIEMARRFHPRPNVRYEVMDIRERFPSGQFETVIWDGAIEHFTSEEIDGIMKKMRGAMTVNARLLGYTVAEPADAPLLPTHETHFANMQHLASLLKRYFKNVRVFERIHPTLSPPRHNLFFYASDGLLPFDQDWEHGLRL
jgi:SAM-dependent methyltransferase